MILELSAKGKKRRSDLLSVARPPCGESQLNAGRLSTRKFALTNSFGHDYIGA
jgi:hypothetical protein